ncbi:MAG: RodZ domain-containing protein [Anaerolineae bacterium]
MGELGQLLREAREKKGLSTAQVEEETRIRQPQIEGLEEQNYEKLPAGIYRKGLLRSYAQYLGLDLNEVMTLYGGEEEQVGPATLVAEGFEPPKGMTISSWLFIDLFLGVLIVASVVVVGILAYNRWFPVSPPSSATPTHRVSLASPVLQLTPTNTPSPTSTATVIPSGRLQVDVEIIARTWLEVTADGEPAFGGLIEAGTNWSWFAEDSIAMHVGNAGGVLVTLNGQELGLLGEPDQVADMEWTWESLDATPEPLSTGSPLPASPSGTPVITTTAVLTPSPGP